MEIIDRQFGDGRQSTILTEILEWEKYKFKLAIKSDTYDFQSYAKIFKWDGEKWHLVYDIHYSEMKTPTDMVNLSPSKKKSMGVEPMQADRNRLIGIAKEIV